MSMPMIEARSLVKNFVRERRALDDVSFQVKQGQIAGLLGHNGAGKSTIVGIMLGMVRPDAGEVYINGCSVQKERGKALRNIGAIFEAPCFYEYMSGWHNLKSLCSLSGWWTEKNVWQVLELVNLTKSIHNKVSTYSHGMKQRLALAQALLPMPKVLLLDEPTDGLDPEGIHEFRSTILNLRERHGLTILMNSHLLSEVELMCDHCIILRGGSKIYEGSMQKTRSEKESYVLGSLDKELAYRTLEALGGQVQIDQGLFTPPIGMTGHDLLAHLMAAGVRVQSWTPYRETLEDWYLKLSHREVSSTAP